MDHASTFAISAAGMAVARARVEVAALNLANAQTSAAPGQASFQPLRVLAQAGAFEALLQGHAALAMPSHHIAPLATPPRAVHDPGHPHADAQGFVRQPGVDTAAEMVGLLGATRAYEANLVAMNATRLLALKALEIGGAS